MGLAYFPMYPDDFEADTAHLTLAEDGAYNRLLRLCWRTPGCSIPADKKWIYRRLRAMSDADKEAINTILDEFFVIADGRYSNARLTKEWVAASEAYERRKKAGSKGGKAKSLKTKETGGSNALEGLKQPEPEPEPEPEATAEKEVLTSEHGREADADADDLKKKSGSEADQSFREKVLVALGHDPTGVTATGRIVGGAAEFAAFEKARAELHLGEAEVISLTEDLMRKRKGQPPNSLKYLIPAMQELAAAKASPAVKPVASKPRTQGPRPHWEVMTEKWAGK